MILGIGLDLIAVDRLRGIETDKQFVEKVYTGAERSEASSRDVPLYYYCTRFAGKEAVFKSLDMNPDQTRINEIEILTNELGKPFVTLHGSVKTAAEALGVKTIHISLSWEKDYAQALAVASG